jgi:hypothetical protein
LCILIFTFSNSRREDKMCGPNSRA